MVKEIRIYWEGGGDSQTGRDFLSKGLSTFLRDLVSIARSKNMRWKLVACGSRGKAYESFQLATKTFPEVFNVLLVDAESPVKLPAWQHLKQQDNWPLAQEFDSQCHLMAQAMEAWFIADVNALEKYFGQGFTANSIPPTQNVEQIPKDRLTAALSEASRQTQKGKYKDKKIKHAGEILQILNVAKVRDAAPHCDLLFKKLMEKMN